MRAVHNQLQQQEERPSYRNRSMRQAAEAAQMWAYAVDGPPEDPLFDAEAEAASAVQSLLGADVVLTSYTVLQQAREARRLARPLLRW